MSNNWKPKKGDFCAKNGSIFIFDKYDDSDDEYKEYYAICGIDVAGRFVADDCSWGLTNEDNPITKATHDEQLLLLETIYDNGFDWDPVKLVLKSTDEVVEELCTSKLNKIIEEAKSFTDAEWIEFNKQTNKYSAWKTLPAYKNPKTTVEDAYELQKRIMKTIIEFIKEKNLDDIYEVEFRADCLQTSVEFGSWCPATDSYLGINGVQKDDNDKYLVRKFITESM